MLGSPMRLGRRSSCRNHRIRIGRSQYGRERRGWLGGGVRLELCVNRMSHSSVSYAP